ncbi:uncharacterized protein K460DRAFT_163728 [Cucurbitaria berberidis CBS 394.84]|uniref:Uncharacterized protein n=1 Tax=Cucurbitaria berberidis CBS 394.84 TaxID=1168544 RepID=A0A9P4GEA9_9PLEO|nr:uncharacterized protein K460DRAFT_163728 [Cucurbitaria berberidis CBS 394.84]KAF1844408.1 hypothetical protein K460DRAFT_163728 [Cucurbitaria berberidis CBS 394.84]
MYPLATLLFLATFAFAVPAPIPDDPAPEPSSVTHLYLCVDSSFKGQCTNMHLDTSTCHNLDQTWNDKVSSAGPDKGTFCTLYSETECRGKALPFTYPGIRNLTRYKFDNVLSSVRCDFIEGFNDHP